MRCDEFEQQLDECLDRRESPTSDASLAAHVASCEGCRVRLNGYSNVVAATAALLQPATPVELSQRVLSELHALPKSMVEARERSWNVPTSAWAALAASLLIAVSLGYWIGGNRWTQNDSIAANERPQVLTPQQVPTGDPSSSVEVAHGAADPTVGNESIGWPIDPRWILPQLVLNDASETNSAGVTTAKSVDRGVVIGGPVDGKAGSDAGFNVNVMLNDEVRSSLAPVAHSTSSALDAFWQVLSANSDDTRL